jgi:hypothetical protein
MQGPVGLATILGLVKRLAVCPPIQLAPDRVDDVIDFNGVSDKGSLKRSILLEGLYVLQELGTGQVGLQDWRTHDHLIIE